MEMSRSEFWRALRSGLMGRCAQCHQAPLFQGYLKPVEICKTCGQNWKPIRADLAPAWAAMTIAAHFLVPFYHFTLFRSALSTGLQIAILCVMAVILCLLLLPRMKGLFMAILWARQTTDS